MTVAISKGKPGYLQRQHVTSRTQTLGNAVIVRIWETHTHSHGYAPLRITLFFMISWLPSAVGGALFHRLYQSMSHVHENLRDATERAAQSLVSRSNIRKKKKTARISKCVYLLAYSSEGHERAESPKYQLHSLAAHQFLDSNKSTWSCSTFNYDRDT